MIATACKDGDSGDWVSLQYHTLHGPGSLASVVVTVRRRESSLFIRCRMLGDISGVQISGNLPAARADNLWRHTCAELFLGVADNQDYCEFNFSPSTQWAAYQFSGYRNGMQVLQCQPPCIQLSRSERSLDWHITLELPDKYRTLPLQTGLCMVVEDQAGKCSYWALQHHGLQPDFHRREGWSFRIV